MDELKPCPFCGGEMSVRIVNYPNGESAWSVGTAEIFGGCFVCSNIPHVEDEDFGEFIAAWNRRVQ